MSEIATMRMTAFELGSSRKSTLVRTTESWVEEQILTCRERFLCYLLFAIERASGEFRPR